MTLGLTVVTHTNTKLKRDISKCVDSVKAALPAGAKHIIIEHDGNFDTFQIARYNAMKSDDIVIFVDDDDYISADSLSHCMNALSSGDYGIAFTREVKVMEIGYELVSCLPSYISDLTKHPEIAHHMVAYNTKLVSDTSLNLALKYKCGVEWIMRVEAASRSGAIHIPIDGYYWIQHACQNYKIPEIQKQFNSSLNLMTAEMKTWIVKDSEIDVWDVNTHID